MNKEKELDMNELIESFGDCSTDYTKTACTYYANYLEEYQKEKIRLEQENNQLKENLKLEKQISDGIAKDYEILLNQKKELRAWLEETIPNTMDTMKRFAFIDVLSKLNGLEDDENEN